MAVPRFDPTASLEIDFGRGRIALRDGGERVLVPADALLSLCRGVGPDTLRDFGRRLGTDVGRRVAESLGEVGSASVESVVEHLGAELALTGLGELGVERWGRALVFTVSGSPLRAEGDELLACVLEGALQRGFGRDAGVVRLTRDDVRVRFLVASRGSVGRVRDWLGTGTPWGETLARLHEAPGGAA